MASAKVLEAKKAEVAALSERFQNACAGVLVDYKGINVADDTALRAELRKEGIEYTVTKNTMIELAVKGSELEGLTDCLKGTTAVATSKDDYVAAARILAKFAKEAEALEIKAGVVEGTYYDQTGIKAISSIPSREELLSKLLGSMQSPITNFARVIKQIAEQQDGAAEA